MCVCVCVCVHSCEVGNMMDRCSLVARCLQWQIIPLLSLASEHYKKYQSTRTGVYLSEGVGWLVWGEVGGGWCGVRWEVVGVE